MPGSLLVLNRVQISHHDIISPEACDTARIAWPTEGSLIALIWDPEDQFLHWMKRRRVTDGMRAKPNLLAQYYPLQPGHKYQFFLIEVPEDVRAPGVSCGLLEKVKYGEVARRGRGPTQIKRSPWSVDVFASALPEDSRIISAVEFFCGVPEQDMSRTTAESTSCASTEDTFSSGPA